MDGFSTAVSDSDKIKAFWDIYETELNHRTWEHASKTTLVYRVNKQENGILHNKDRIHAEENLKSILLQKSGEKKRMDVTVYINNSPCYECAQSLTEFLVENPQVNISIYVASLYNINRRSCMGEQHRVYQNYSDSNSKGLRMLNDLNCCKINVFDKPFWEDLTVILCFPLPLFYKIYGEKVKGDRSRETEDKRLKDDLDYILQKNDFLVKVFDDMFFSNTIEYCCVLIISEAEPRTCTSINELNENLDQTKTRKIFTTRSYMYDEEKYSKFIDTLIKHLYESYLSQNWQTMQVVLCINRSPCNEFSSRLIDFLTEIGGAVLCIYSADIHKIESNRRISVGLRHLLFHSRCKFIAFNKNVWEVLIHTSGINRPDFDQEYVRKMQGFYLLSRSEVDRKGQDALDCIRNGL